MSETKAEVGLVRNGGRRYFRVSSIVNYGVGHDERLTKSNVETGAREIIREIKRRKKIVSQDEAIKIAHEARYRKLKEAGDLGTRMHLHANANVNKRPGPDVIVDDAPYYRGLLNWLKVNNLAPILTEKRLYDDIEQITGKPDFFGYWNGRKVIFDFKSNNFLNPKWGLQLAAYRHLLELWQYIEPGEQVDTYVLHMTPEFAYPIKYYETWSAFKTTKDMFLWKYYRLKPGTYENTEDDENTEGGKKEASDITSETSEEQSLAHETNSQGHQRPQAGQEPSTTTDYLRAAGYLPPEELYRGQADKSLRGTTAPQSLPAGQKEKRRRGRPRKDPSASTSSRKAATRPQTRPEEVELEPKHVHPKRLKRRLFQQAA